MDAVATVVAVATVMNALATVVLAFLTAFYVRETRRLVRQGAEDAMRRWRGHVLCRIAPQNPHEDIYEVLNTGHTSVHSLSLYAWTRGEMPETPDPYPRAVDVCNYRGQEGVRLAAARWWLRQYLGPGETRYCSFPPLAGGDEIHAFWCDEYGPAHRCFVYEVVRGRRRLRPVPEDGGKDPEDLEAFYAWRA